MDNIHPQSAILVNRGCGYGRQLVLVGSLQWSSARSSKVQTSEWAVTDEELRVRGGLYQIARIGDGWSARYRALRDGHLGRCVDVHTLDAEGNAKPWPTRGIAKMACDSHHERMANHGESADLASAWVARNTDMFERR